MKIRGVVGLDLSLRAAAACFIPRRWNGDTRKLSVATWGYGLERDATHVDHAERRAHIADSVQSWVLAKTSNGPVRVFVEDYAFSRRSQSLTGLAELGGVVKDRLHHIEMCPTPVTASAARKTLLQKLPKKDVKQFTEDNVRRLLGEALYWNGDEIDAFVCANYGVALLNIAGWSAVSFPGKP